MEILLTYKKLLTVFLLFITSMTLSSLYGMSEKSIYIEIVKYFVRYLFIFIILLYFYKQSFFSKKSLLTILFSILLIHSLDGIYQYISGVDLIADQVPDGPSYMLTGAVYHHNPFGLLMAVGAIISLTLFFDDNNYTKLKYDKIIYLVSLPMFLFTLFHSQSRSAWVMFGIYFIGYMLLYVKRTGVNKKLFLTLFFLLIVIAMLFLLDENLLHRLSLLLQGKSSGRSTVIWPFTLDKIMDGILKGNVGFFSQYSDIEKMDMKEIIQKKENAINALFLQQKRLNTIDKRKINSKIEMGNTKIEELIKRIDTIKKNKLQVQNTLEISLSQIENVNANTREIIEQREKTLKENSDQIALLMYSNIIQQNIAFKNSLQQQILVLEKQINQYVDKENEYSQEISMIKKQIQDLMLDRDDSLALRNQEIVLQINNKQEEIESIKAKLSIVTALEIIQHPKSSNSPVKPEKVKIVLMSFFAGLFLSIILSIIIQRKLHLHPKNQLRKTAG